MTTKITSRQVFFPPAKMALLCLCLVLLGLMLGLSFWSYPKTDDYALFFYRQHFGFLGTQAWIFDHNSGRYAAGFLATLMSLKNFLYNHYYLHSIVLILATVASIYWTLGALLRKILQREIPPIDRLIHSIVLFLCFTISLPEVFTAYYWFCSAITYQPPIILSILLAGVLIKLDASAPAVNKFVHGLSALLILVLIIGFNELVALLITAAVAVTATFVMRRKLAPPVWVFTAVALNLLCLTVILSSKGLWERSAHFSGRSVVRTLGYDVFWLSSSWWQMLRQPVVLFLVVMAFLAGNRSQKLDLPIFRHTRNIPSFHLLAGFILIEFFSMLPIVYVTAGSFALRALNSLVILNILAAFVIAFHCGLSSTFSIPESFLDRIKKYFSVTICILLLSNSWFYDLGQTMISGYFYNEIMKSRYEQYESARREGLKTVRLQEYSASLNKHLNEAFDGQPRVTIRRLTSQKPVFLTFKEYDDAKTDLITNRLLLNYYRLDTIAEGNRIFKDSVRIELLR